ncbi:MAG: iron-containing alcohol dehydrogenase, partial [Planctomycetes bacterium]|nr:iron-containing alcohol dehydrogenase [Planctomycetota bacterium]
VVDIMLHTMERYFSNDKGTELTDRLAEAVLVTVMENAHRLLKDPNNYNARAEIMWAGSVSHNGITGAGKVGDWASHQLEHELSGMWDVTHGAGLAVIWPSWARYVYKHDIPRFVQFATRVLGVRENYENPEETALKGIDAMVDFFKSIHMPTTITEMGVGEVTPAQVEEMAVKCTRNGRRTAGTFVVLHKEDMKKIYEMSI